MGRKSARGGAALGGALLLAAMAAATHMRLDALEVEMSEPAMERALRLARFPASDADRARFHSRYIFQAAGPVVDGLRLQSIEIITEFRRTELVAEEHARINDLFGRSSLTEVRHALEPWHGRVYVAARVSLLNAPTTVALPSIAVALDDLQTVGAVEAQNTYSENALVGGVVAVPFDTKSVGQATRIVTVMMKGTVLGRARVDFRALD